MWHIDHTWNNVWGQILYDLHHLLHHHHHVGYVLTTSPHELVSHTCVYNKDVVMIKGIFLHYPKILTMKRMYHAPRYSPKNCTHLTFLSLVISFLRNYLLLSQSWNAMHYYASFHKFMSTNPDPIFKQAYFSNHTN